MNRRIVPATALAFALLGAALGGCGSQDGSLVGYSPEGQASNALLLSDVQPDTRLTVVFTDTLTNTGDTLDTFEFTGSADFPAGTAFGLFKSDGITPISDTNGNHAPDSGPMDPGAFRLIQVHATLPGGVAGGPYAVVLNAASTVNPRETAAATNILGEVYPAIRTGPTESALPGALGEELSRAAEGPGAGTITLQSASSRVAPVRVDATASLTLTGQTIERAWPTFSDRLLVTGLILDNSTVDGFRIYANPGNQGFRPAEDFIAAPQANWTTGWRLYSIRLTTFDPAVGTDLVGRGAYRGIESGAAPLTEHSYLPIATPVDLVHRLDVALVSPEDSLETDSIPVLTWAPTAGASRYLVELTGRSGLQYLALTEATTHRVQGESGLIVQNLSLRDGQLYRWVIIAVDDRNRIIGFSHEVRAIQVKTH